MPRIILASGSPRRKKLLAQTGLRFEVKPSHINEDFFSDDPVLMVETLAREKASSIAKSYPDSIIIGADTIVVQNDLILGKPENSEEAAAMLSRLSNTFHTVYTAVSLILTGKNDVVLKEQTFHEQTKVYFSALSDKEIQAYIHGGSPFDKAGAYGIQDDMGALFVNKIEGDFYNVMGFPLNRFYNEMKKFAPDVIRWNDDD